METNPTPKLSDRDIISSVEMNNPNTSRRSFERYSDELVRHNTEAVRGYLEILDGATTTEEELRALAHFVIKVDEDVENVDRRLLDDYTALLANAYSTLCEDYITKLHPPDPDGRRVTLIRKEALADFMFSYRAVLLLNSTPTTYDKETQTRNEMQQWMDLTPYVTPLNGSAEAIHQSRKILDETLAPDVNRSLDDYALDNYFQDNRSFMLTVRIEEKMNAGLLDFEDLFYLGVEQRIYERNEDTRESVVLDRIAQIKEHQPHVYYESGEVYQNQFEQNPELDMQSALRVVAFVDLYHKIASDCL